MLHIISTIYNLEIDSFKNFLCATLCQCQATVKLKEKVSQNRSNCRLGLTTSPMAHAPPHQCSLVNFLFAQSVLYSCRFLSLWLLSANLGKAHLASCRFVMQEGNLSSFSRSEDMLFCLIVLNFREIQNFKTCVILRNSDDSAVGIVHEYSRSALFSSFQIMLGGYCFEENVNKNIL